MSDLTLPGTIPGLLRRCSPITRLTYGSMTPQESSCVLRVGPDGTFDIGAPGVLAWIPGRQLVLDLTDATGRAHAAWWLAVREVPGGCHLDPAAVSWSRAPAQAACGWALHWRARAMLGGGSLTGSWWTGSHGSPVPAVLANLDPNDDRRLPDGSRAVDAEALRRVVLHVAGVADV